MAAKQTNGVTYEEVLERFHQIRLKQSDVSGIFIEMLKSFQFHTAVCAL